MRTFVAGGAVLDIYLPTLARRSTSILAILPVGAEYPCTLTIAFQG
jgi:hypothetical protein